MHFAENPNIDGERARQLQIVAEEQATFPVEPGTQEVCQRWVFESPMDAQFKQNLDWRVVDVNNVMDGAQFWAEK